MSKKANFFAIGLFVIASFVIAVGTFIAFGAGNLTKDTAIIVSTFRGSANGLREGAKVKAYGVDVGLVKGIKLHRMEVTDEVVIPVLMEIDLNQVSNLLGFRSLHDDNAEFCLRALERDAHATLQLDSFVTGLLYVEIVFGIDQPGFVLRSDRFADYRSMPTIPTDMEMMLRSLQTLAQNLQETDISGLVAEARDTVRALRTRIEPVDIKGMETNINALVEKTTALVESEDFRLMVEELPKVLAETRQVGEFIRVEGGQTLATLDSTLTELQAISNQARTLMDPSSPIYLELVDAFDQVGDASRSLRILLDYLERNPNALLTGRSEENPTP